MDFASYWSIGATGALVGLLIGSFLNVVIHRGPALWGLIDHRDLRSRGNLFAPRSYCPACRTRLQAWRLIPVLSYLAQRGRCATCGAPIALRYPLVEVGGAVIGVVAVIWSNAPLQIVATAVLGWSLLCLAAIDAETGFLPDAITLPLIGLGLATSALPDGPSPLASIIGAVAGFAAFAIVGAVYAGLRGRDGLGGGDAKLLAALGAWTGWAALPAIVFLAAVGTLIGVGVAVVIRKARPRGGPVISSTDPIPFGPGLCAAGFLAYLAVLQGAIGL